MANKTEHEDDRTIEPASDASQMTVDPSAIRSEVIQIGPKQAMELLSESNTHNRNVRSDLVNAYARDMRNGKWRYLGDPIRFGTGVNGSRVLLDGQHRLLAVAKSGSTLPFRVEHGYRSGDQSVMDSGATRHLSDNLKLRGHGNSIPLAAIARKLYSWIHFGHPSIKVGKVSNSELTALIESERWGPALREAASFAASHSRSKLVAPSVIGLFHVIFSDKDADKAEWFLLRVEDGAELPTNHPAMVFRRRMISDRDGTGRPSDMHQAACLVIAWNAFRKNQRISVIKLPQGGVTTANFPQPI